MPAAHVLDESKWLITQPPRALYDTRQGDCKHTFSKFLTFSQKLLRPITALPQCYFQNLIDILDIFELHPLASLERNIDHIFTIAFGQNNSFDPG
jgi:hypothetical protein